MWRETDGDGDGDGDGHTICFKDADTSDVCQRTSWDGLPEGVRQSSADSRLSLGVLKV